jgi:hypothetical protein
MKKALSLILIFYVQLTMAQVMIQKSDSKKMKAFLNSKTLFVLTGDKDFDEKLKNSVSKYWKVTPFDFIAANERKQYEKDEKYSFLTMNEFKGTSQDFYRQEFLHRSAAESFETNSQNIYTLIGGGSSLDKYNIESWQIGYGTMDLSSKLLDIKYRIEYLIKGLNDGVEILKNNAIKGNEDKVAETVFDKFSSNAKVLKSKVLLVDSEYTVDNTKVKGYKSNLLSGKIPGKMVDLDDLKKNGINYEVMPHNRVMELVSGDNSNYCYLCPTNRSCFKTGSNSGVRSMNMNGMMMGGPWFIFDLETKNIVFAYLNEHAPVFDKKAVEKLSLAVR